MIRDVDDFLKNHYPFSSLPGETLGAVSSHIIVRYYPEGEVIFGEGSKPLEYLYIVRKGAVVLLVDDKEIDFLQEGDVFGYPSLLSGDPPTSTAKAVQDTILYLLPKEIFLKLVEKYEEFDLFFAKSLARKLSSTMNLVKAPLKERGSLERFLTLKVKDLKVRKVPFVSGSTSVFEATKIMRDKDLTCLFVLSNGIGIVTERDIIKKVIAEGRDPKTTPLGEIATSPVISVEEESFIFEAMLRMARNNIRRIGVTRRGELVGVLEDKDIIAYESKNLLVLMKEIEKARTVEDLKYLHSLVTDLVVDLFLEGLKVTYIGRLISELSDKIMGRAVLLTIREIGTEPPVSFSLMVLGSEGRREQTLKTDQDNALVYDDTYPVIDANVEDYFSRFGTTYSDILIRIGFPPCPGDVMVRNPSWRKGITGWRETVSGWFSRPDPNHTLKVGIFFDLRNVFGNADLVEDLRDHIFRTVDRNDLFLAYMLLDAVRVKPPVGFMRRIVIETRGEHRGEFDIKKGGIFPVTQGVRALALRGKIRETSTVERIERLTASGDIPADLGEDLKEAYIFLQTIRLKSQIDKIRSGKKPDNYVNPEKLSKIERDLLRDSLRVVTEFQSFIERRFTGFLPR